MAEKKEIVSIEILHLDEAGYGPAGKHTRRQWREECLTHLLAGKAEFEEWQSSWQAQAEDNTKRAQFGLVIHYQDGSVKQFDGFFATHASHALDFSGGQFEPDLDCYQFNFQVDSLFYFAQFSGRADFRESQFAGDAYFRESQFAGDAYFSASQFSGYADFSALQFSGYADFSALQFSGYAYFLESQFAGDAYFSASQFSGNAYFRASQFSGSAVFSASQFSGSTIFTKTVFASGSNFYQTVFAKSIKFENASFANVGHFEQAMFQTHIPAFRGCKIDATRLEFSDESHFSQTDFDEDAIKNISFLKRLSDQHGQVDQAIEFNAMELRAKRKQAWQLLYSAQQTEGFWFCAFTWLYETVSNCGRSFMRPLIALLGLCCITWLFAFCSAEKITALPDDTACIQCEQVKKLPLSPSRAATEYTLYRASGLFHFTDKGRKLDAVHQRLFGQTIEPPKMRLWGLITSFLSTVLFFLIALGLRNRYRIK